jgi:hypothetical protein
VEDRFKKELTRRKELLKQQKKTGGTLQTGGNDKMWLTPESNEKVTEEIKRKLIASELYLYVISSVWWRDPTGNHYLNVCRLLQPPATGTSDAIWHLCNDWSDHR